MQGDFPIETRDFFYRAKEILGIKFFTKHFKVSKTEAYRWCAPAINEERRKNPLDRFELLFDALIMEGEQELAFLLADRFVRKLKSGDSSGEISFRDRRSDKETFQEEIIDTLAAISKLVEAAQNHINRKIHVSELRQIKKDAHKEIDELFDRATQEAITE